MICTRSVSIFVWLVSCLWSTSGGAFDVPNNSVLSSFPYFSSDFFCVRPNNLLGDARAIIQKQTYLGNILAHNCQWTVRDRDDCGLAISNVTVQVWYTGEPDNELGNNFYQPDDCHGQIMMDDCGQYQLRQTFSKTLSTTAHFCTITFTCCPQTTI